MLFSFPCKEAAAVPSCSWFLWQYSPFCTCNCVSLILTPGIMNYPLLYFSLPSRKHFMPHSSCCKNLVTLNIHFSVDSFTSSIEAWFYYYFCWFKCSFASGLAFNTDILKCYKNIFERDGNLNFYHLVDSITFLDVDSFKSEANKFES